MNSIGKIGLIMPEITDPLDYELRKSGVGYSLLLISWLDDTAAYDVASIAANEAVQREKRHDSPAIPKKHCITKKAYRL